MFGSHLIRPKFLAELDPPTTLTNLAWLKLDLLIDCSQEKHDLYKELVSIQSTLNKFDQSQTQIVRSTLRFVRIIYNLFKRLHDSKLFTCILTHIRQLKSGFGWLCAKLWTKHHPLQNYRAPTPHHLLSLRIV